MSTHTPGPWERYNYIGHPGGLRLVRAKVANKPLATCERHEDARLIAAAPDLLAACEAAEGLLRNRVLIATNTTDCLELLETLRAAIQKARR